MEAPAGRELAAPRALRPAQLGVILVARVTLAHIGATVVDLAGRGHVRLEPVEDDGPDWELTALERASDGLLAYERTLLDGLFDGPQDIRLGQVTARMTPMLDQVRSQVVRDAVGAGLLGHGLVRRLLTRGHLSRPGQGPVKRTRAGEELLEEIKAFRRELRASGGRGGRRRVGGVCTVRDDLRAGGPVPIVGGAPRQPADGADPRAQTADFAARWHKAWEAAAPPRVLELVVHPAIRPGHSACAWPCARRSRRGLPGTAAFTAGRTRWLYGGHGGGFGGHV